MARQCVVGEQDRYARPAPHDPGIHGLMPASDRHLLDAEAMEQLIGAVSGLGDPMQVEQAESAMERHRREVVLREEIGECPEAVSLDQSARLHHGLGHEGGGVGLVVQGVARVRGSVPFRVIDGPAPCLLMHFSRPLAQDAARSLGQLLDRLIRFLAQSRPRDHVRRVVVRADEVGGQVILLAEIEEARDPLVLRRGRPADAQLRVHPLDRLHRVAIQLEVIILGPGPEMVQVGLIPDLEKPGAHFGEAVAFHPVLRQLANQSCPGLVVLRGRHVAGISEDGLASGGQGSGHQAQLDKGLHADAQQKVPNLIDVKKRIERLFPVDDERPHVIREQAVKAHVAKAQLVVAAP